MTKIDSTGKVAVDPGYYWNEDMSTCPHGVKVQLLRYGVAIYGQVSSKDAHLYAGWVPLPKLKREPK